MVNSLPEEGGLFYWVGILSFDFLKPEYAE